MVQMVDDGYRGSMSKAVKSQYKKIKCAVKVNDIITSFLDVTLRVKQGCRLSPTRFCNLY